MGVCCQKFSTLFGVLSVVRLIVIAIPAILF